MRKIERIRMKIDGERCGKGDDGVEREEREEKLGEKEKDDEEKGTRSRKIQLIGKGIRKRGKRKKRTIMNKTRIHLPEVLCLKTLQYCLQHQKKLTTLNHWVFFSWCYICW
jgi:hypothetical protein